VAWELWHQDSFDRESPRQVEAAGRGLVQGLYELWAHHLRETVGARGQRGFSRFNLWLKREGKSIRIVGSWEGMTRLRDWVYSDGERVRAPDLLRKVATLHAKLVLEKQDGAAILAAAGAEQSRASFENWLEEQLFSE
jgi:hypothetical protein